MNKHYILTKHPVCIKATLGSIDTRKWLDIPQSKGYMILATVRNSVCVDFRISTDGYKHFPELVKG